MNPQFQMFSDNVDKYIEPDSITSVYDIGAGKCEETLLLREKYKNAIIYAFEANPDNIATCAANVANIDRIVLIPLCVAERTRIRSFYPVSRERSPDKNLLASSSYKWQAINENYLPGVIQDEIKIPCACIDDVIDMFDLPAPEIIWMDLQGSELNALIGLEKYLYNVKFIHTELYNQKVYVDAPLYGDVKSYLEDNGLVDVTVNPPVGEFAFDDFDFVRKFFYDRAKNESSGS